MHELGHAVVAKALRFHIVSFRVGTGPVLAKFSIGSTAVDLRWFPMGGLVRVAPIGPRRLRARLVCVHLAGVGAVVGCAALVVLVASPALGLAAVIVALTQVGNLVPHTISMETQKLPNDALKVCRELFRPSVYMPPQVHVAVLNQFREETRRRDWNACRATAADMRRRFPDDNAGLILESMANSQLGEPLGLDLEAAVRLWTPEPVPYLRGMLALLTNEVVYYDLLDRRTPPDPVVDVMRRAHGALPNQAMITDTLAWVLIESGAVDEGLELSASIDETQFADAPRAAVLAVRAIGCTKAGRPDDAERLRVDAVSLDPECPLIEHLDAISAPR